MDNQEFKRWVRATLGQGDFVTCIEVSDSQIEFALDTAKDWFNSFIGLHKEASLSLVSGTSEYDLSAIVPAVDNVVNVWFPKQGIMIDFSVLYPGFLDVQGVPYKDVTLFGGPYPQTTMVQTLQNLKSLGKILDVELSWDFYREDIEKGSPVRKLRIMPAPKFSGTAIYLYRIDPKDIKLHMYKPRDLYIIREWALAEVKYMLGRVRGKYPSGLPAAGGERPMDGDVLIQESMADKERLRQQVLDYDGPTLPLVG
jgi:hypothetical protein